jgi:hypothetical protein
MEEDFGRPKRRWRMLGKQVLEIVCDGVEKLLWAQTRTSGRLL